MARKNKLIKQDKLSFWYNKAIKFLSFRPRSIKEIRDYLTRGQIEKDIAELILKKLAKFNLVNDEEFAKWFIEQRITFRPKSKFIIKNELLQKGIDLKLIDQVLNTSISTTDELNLARRLIQKKSHLWQDLDQNTRRIKISRYLYQHGFSWNQINQIIGS